jgi:hypothetical protein
VLRELTVTSALRTGVPRLCCARTRRWRRDRELADLAVLTADGDEALTRLATLRAQERLLGVVESVPTAWQCVEQVNETHLSGCGRSALPRGSRSGRPVSVPS